MIKNSTLLLAALALAGCSHTDSPQKVLTGATLIDGSGAAPIPGAVVVIDNGRITAAGPEASTKIPAGFEKVNLGGKFIVPGLVDVHVTIDPDPAKGTAELQTFVAAGVTSVGADGAAGNTGAHVFPSLGRQAGIADLVIASNGSAPDATFAKIDRMAKAEIAPVQIIQAATGSGAAWLQQTTVGTIQAGQRADLLILNADPLADIKNLRQIDRVMLDGRWVAIK
jgi:imidazolonepropionase-like amidohydrolase